MVVILYPSFAIFSVFHAHFIQKRGEDLSKTLFTGREGWLKKENETFQNSK
jgi:hypothetical protein